jgi:acid phosphatase (class A)
MRKNTAIIFLALAGLLLTVGCATQHPTSLSKEILEVRPGILQGYLAEDELPNSLDLLPPPPEEGSIAFGLDQAMAAYYVALQDDARKAQAVQDNVLSFPEATAAFQGVLPISISEETTPHIYMILRRTLADAGLSTYAAKNHYQRPRPFMVNGTPTLTPDEEVHLRKDGSYPSGHTAIGWAWALILTELFPEQTDAILKSGKAFGISRMVCNVHWHSDVVAGRMMGSATVARLHGDDDFLNDLEAAKRKIHRLAR